MALAASDPAAAAPGPVPSAAAILVHGGAGDWAAGAAAGVACCRRAAQAGLAVLEAGGSAVDAVVAAGEVLEDDPACNAGTGAALTSAGTLELDSSVMDGSSRLSGAVAALPPFRHPVGVARAVMDDGRHNLLVGQGAAAFAVANGFDPADPRSMMVAADPDHPGRAERGNTVGAVALDGQGRLAAATSTGGIEGQAPGRVGDTPIVGAGTYADRDAACSCTGDGESFARACAAFAAVGACHDTPPQQVAESTLSRVDRDFDGRGGIILLDRHGTAGIAHTMPAMPWALGRTGAEVESGS